MATSTVVRLKGSAEPTSVSGSVFRKQILRYGEWLHPKAPGGKIKIDRELVEKIIANFRAKVLDHVPVPITHDDKDAVSSIGEIIDLEADEQGLWGIHHITDKDAVSKIDKKTWRGSSATLNLDWLDRESGERIGPVLMNNVITNLPVITKLAPFEAVALGEAAAADATVISLPEEAVRQKEGKMTLEELLEKLLETPDEELARELRKRRPELVTLLGGETTDEDAVKAAAQQELVEMLKEKGVVIELPQKTEDGKDADPTVEVPEVVALSQKVAALEEAADKKAASDKVEDALRKGLITPAQKESYLELALSNAELFDKMLPEEPIIEFGEIGTFEPTAKPKAPMSDEDTATEVGRYLETYGGKAAAGGE